MTANPLGPGAAGAGSGEVSHSDEAHLHEMGFSPSDVFSRVKNFFNSSRETSLSLGKDRIISQRSGILDTNFKNDQDVSFLFRKALEASTKEAPDEMPKLFFDALQACKTLGIDDKEVLSLKPFITVKIKEAPSGAGGSIEEDYNIPLGLLANAPLMQKMIFGFDFSRRGSLTLPEGYTLEHFKAYVEMSTNPAYDFLTVDPSLILDIVSLTGFFKDTGLSSRLIEALKTHPDITLEDARHAFENLTVYTELESCISPIINTLIRIAIHNNEPDLDTLIAQIHSLDDDRWLSTHTLDLDLSDLHVDDATLESLSSLKVSNLNIANSGVTKLPESFLDSLQVLDISNSQIAVLQRLPHLRSLIAWDRIGPTHKPSLTDISKLEGNPYLETLKITASISTFPPGLSNLKTLHVYGCQGMTNLDALNGCAKLEDMKLIELKRLERVPSGLSALKHFDASFCLSLTNLDPLNGCTNLENMSLLKLNLLERVPSGLSALKHFDASFCLSLTNLDPLSGCTNLENMSLLELNLLERVPSGLSALKSFRATNCPSLTNLDPLSGCTNLADMILNVLVHLESVPSGLSALKSFRAHSCFQLKNLDPFNNCITLEEMSLNRLDTLERIPKGLLGLKRFQAIGCDRITDLSPLNYCKHLEEKEIGIGGPSIADLD